jgi:hypothetical protein
VSGGFARDWPGTGGAESLADLQLSTDAQLGAGLPAGAASAATLIALVAAPIADPTAALEHRLPGADVDALQALPAQVRMLLAVDTSPAAGPGEAPAGDGERRRGGPAAPPTALSELAGDGWHVHSASVADPIPDAWAALLTAPGHAVASRA